MIEGKRQRVHTQKDAKYDGTRTIASTDIQKDSNTMKRELYQAQPYKKKTSKYDGMRTTQRAQTHTRTLKRHTFYTCQRFFCSPMF